MPSSPMLTSPSRGAAGVAEAGAAPKPRSRMYAANSRASLSAASALARLASRSRVSSSTRAMNSDDISAMRLDASRPWSSSPVFRCSMWSRSASFSRFASSARRSSPRTSSSVGSRASASAMKLARSSTVESFSPGERSPGKIHAGLERAATPDVAKSGERGALAGVAAPDATLGESARVPKGVLGVLRGFSRVPEGAGLGESTAADVDFTRRVNGVRSSFPTRDGRLAPTERDAEGADDADRVAPPARPGVADPPSQAESGRPRASSRYDAAGACAPRAVARQSHDTSRVNGHLSVRYSAVSARHQQRPSCAKTRENEV